MSDADQPNGRTRPTVLLVCAQPSLTSSALYCLKGMGAKVIAVGDPGMRFLRYSRFCAAFVPCDVIGADLNWFVAHINALADKYRVDVIAPGDNDSQLLLAAVKDRLEASVFPLPASEQLVLLNDKHAFHETCVQIGVPVPASVFFADKHGLDPVELGERFGYPLIVKPTTWGGSDGVVLAESADDLRERIIDNDEYRFQPLVAQEFVPGEDVGLNVLAVDGDALLAAPQMRQGDEVTQLDDDRLVALGKKYVEATGLTGLAHLDARLDPEGRVTFLECNPRIWSSICHSHWCGENYVAAGVRHAMGHSPAGPTQISGRSVTAPARLLSDLARRRRGLRSLNRYERRAIAEGISDPVLLFRRYFERSPRQDAPSSN